MKRLKVMIVGAGLSSLVLANRLSETADVTIITKGGLSNNNSIRAQGGIAAPIHSRDDWKQHIKDTLEAGVFYNNPNAVEILVKEGKYYVEKLLEDGFFADRTSTGELDLGREGAHSTRRIIRAGGDQTGKHLMAFYHHLLKDKVNWGQRQLAVKSIVEDGVCKGLVTSTHITSTIPI